MRTRLLRSLALLVALAGPVPALAETMLFDVVMKGLKAGELELSLTETAATYRIDGRLESTGLLSLIRKVRYDAKSQGARRGGDFLPRSYSEITDTGQRVSEAAMTYTNGMPSVRRYVPARPPRDTDVDPATQIGTVDPLTGLFLALRDAPEDRACARSQRLFDGRRATRVRAGQKSAGPERIVCQGAFERVAGYTKKDMAEDRAFPFQMTLVPGENGLWQVERVEIRTLYGPARLIRR